MACDISYGLCVCFESGKNDVIDLLNILQILSSSHRRVYQKQQHWQQNVRNHFEHVVKRLINTVLTHLERMPCVVTWTVAIVLSTILRCNGSRVHAMKYHKKKKLWNKSQYFFVVVVVVYTPSICTKLLITFVFTLFNTFDAFRLFRSTC